MSDIREWLVELGLGRYAVAFEENRLSVEQLPSLTHELLKEIGVTAVGDRLTLLDAAQNTHDAPAPAKPDVAARTVTPEAERRQLTVMFCDLVGSTALSEQLDPEDLRALMAAYQKACGAVVGRYEGHVAQYLGDGLMVYFGWPQAHEDDAQRAVRAGLEIVTAVKSVAAPGPLQVRVGIATGPVVVGETGAGDATVPKAAVGETPNLAARVHALAGPDQLVIAPTTHRLTGGAFDYDDLGEQTLKGVAAPVRLWKVLGESQAEGRFEARTVGGLTPLVGRESELVMLMERWEQAKEGEGQVVLLWGEPGIGKSRVTQELRERLADEPHTRLRYQCSPYYANSAFYPVIDQLERAAGFARDESTDTKLDKLEALLVQSAGDASQVAPLLAAMLSLPIDRYPPLNLSPQRQKDDTIVALAAQVTALADRQPLLMLFEDAHWCDPTTLETLTAVIGQIEAVPVLLVITYRPEFEPPWTGHGHVVMQSLGRLGKRQGADMVARVTGGKTLPGEVLDQIVAKTDGVPLFVEELTKTVLEAGYLKDAGVRYELDGPLPPLAIPATLQDSLMARLDRLDTVKEVAQIGACIGREFSIELLTEISPLSDNELQDALQKLVDSELILHRGIAADARYIFKHALIQDAAYDSLLKSRRQHLHTSIAKALESRLTEVTTGALESVAQHYSAAGLVKQAIPYWIRAGKDAVKRFANVEAIRHLERGHELLQTLPESRQRDEEELDLLANLGAAVASVHGQGATRVGEIFTLARSICDRMDGATLHPTILTGLRVYHLMRAEHADSLEIARESFSLAKLSNDAEAQILAYMATGAAALWLGRPLEALEDFCGGYELYEHHGSNTSRVLVSYHPVVGILDYQSWAYWWLGRPDSSIQKSRECAAMARELDHPQTTASILAHAAVLESVRGDAAAAQTAAIRAIETSREAVIPMRRVEGEIIDGWAKAELGEPAIGAKQVGDGIAEWRKMGNRIANSWWFTLLSQARRRSQDLVGAMDALSEALETIEQTGEHLFDPEVYRVQGDILLADSRLSKINAEDSFQRARSIAVAQHMKSFELRAATSLARLWRSQGKTKEAHDLLFPVYDWFTEGFDTADLKDAKALLEELK